MQLVLAARRAEQVSARPLDAARQSLVRGGVAGVQAQQQIRFELRLAGRDVTFKKGNLSGDVQILGELARRGHHAGPAVDATHPYRVTADACQIGVDCQRQIGPAATAVHDAQFPLLPAVEHGVDHLEEFVDLVVFAAHGGFDAPIRTRDADDPQERAGVEGRQRLTLDAVVRRIRLGFARQRCAARHHRLAFPGDPHMQVP